MFGIRVANRCRQTIVSILTGLALTLPAIAYGHGGGLDSLGCHHNRKAGGYHCHRGPLAGQSFSSKAEAQAALARAQSKEQRSEQSLSGSTRSSSDSEKKSITAAEAKNHIGEMATVCGKVVSTRYAASSRGRPTFLNLDKPYPNQEFTIVIWGDDRAKFGKPEEEYKDKEVCVTGKIETYRGKPQIEAKESRDIVLKASKIKEN